MTSSYVPSVELDRIMSSKSSHTDAWRRCSETAPTVSPLEPVYLFSESISESLNRPSFFFKLKNVKLWILTLKRRMFLIQCLVRHEEKSN